MLRIIISFGFLSRRFVAGQIPCSLNFEEGPYLVVKFALREPGVVIWLQKIVLKFYALVKVC